MFTVVCASHHRPCIKCIPRNFALHSKSFVSSVTGLLPPRELLATSKTIDLIYEGVKYSLSCCQAGPRFFTVTTLTGDGERKLGGGGKALVEAQCRPLADGGYLLVIAGKSQARDVIRYEFR